MVRSAAVSEVEMLMSQEWWKRDKYLGSGAFGAVWLEDFVTENGAHQCRAVKEIGKWAENPNATCYSRELEAVAKVSHPKVRDSFFPGPSVFL